jgi:hypothetical protein
MIESREQYPHMLQIKLMRRRLGQFVSKSEHSRNCGFVRHP